MNELGDAKEAAQAGDLDRVRDLVTAHPDLVRRRDDQEHSILDHALWALLVGDYSRPPTIAPDPHGRRMAVVRYLLDAGADPNGRSQHDWTPLHTALYENHVELTRLLLARGGDPSAEVYGSGGTPLVQALFWGHVEAAETLAVVSIEPLNLRVAAGLGRLDLIAGFFDANGVMRPSAGAHREYYRPHSDFPEWTPSDDRQEILDEAFVYACRNGRSEALTDLLVRGADVNGAPYAGSALHWAASQGRLAICRWLLGHGADTNLRTTFGAQLRVTPLHACAWRDQLDVAKLLVENGADLDAHDETHDSPPLGWAEYMGSERVAAYLRTAG